MRFIKKHYLILIPLSVYSSGALSATDANYRGFEQLPTSFGCSSYPTEQADGRCAEGTYTTFADNDYVYVYTCPAGNDIVVGPDTKEVDKKWSSSQGKWITVTHPIYQCVPVEQCEELSHEDGNPEGILCGVCAPGYILPPGIYSPDSGSPFSTGYECMRNREPNECQYLDKFEVVTEQGAFCVDQCAGIGDDGFCIDEAEKDPNEPDCSPDHPEFKGVAGYGGEAVLICGDPQNNCPTDYTWGVVQKGNTTVESCFPNAYNPPQCSGTDVLTKNQWGGFACLPLAQPGDNPDPGGENDPNNGDSDGDGQGDITGITGQLQDIKSLLGRGNTNTNNINETLKGIGKQIGDGTKAITDAIGNIPGGGGGGTGTGDGEGDGDNEPPVTWSGDPITLEVSDGLDELNAVQGEYDSLVASIRAEMTAAFGSFTGAGGLQDNTITLFGETFNAGLSKFGADLSILGSIILFAATFIALGIIMGARD